MQIKTGVLVLLGALAGAYALHAAPLERGTAITDPHVLRELDAARFGLGRMLDPARASDFPTGNDELFAFPSMLGVREAIDDEFSRYVVRQRAILPNETIGVGSSFNLQLFDREALYSAQTRFVLAGIVNRMDRAYLAPQSCGEIRIIYRLARTGPAEDGRVPVVRRLPMTLSLVLKAGKAHAATRDGDASSCADIARRWLDTADLSLAGPELTASLMSRGSALELIRSDDIDRIEINLQIAHTPKSAVRAFRTDYLLKVFRYDARANLFLEAPLDNQIDRERIVSDEKLRREFRAWLLEARHLDELDRGTIQMPDKFLASSAIAATPVGFGSSTSQPAFGLVQPDTSGEAVLRQGEVVVALKQAADSGIVLQNIRSVGGFERRLNDVTCSGCHQIRSIGGFHFPGVEWMAAKPSISAVVPASPHFFGDQTRRRDILRAMRDGTTPDFSRGFSDRPQSRGSAELAGTAYDDGWGAHCYRQLQGTTDDDESFRSWTCAEGLVCQPVDETSRIGMCFVNSR